jgi:adenosine/AMP kinase
MGKKIGAAHGYVQPIKGSFPINTSDKKIAI